MAAALRTFLSRPDARWLLAFLLWASTLHFVGHYFGVALRLSPLFDRAFAHLHPETIPPIRFLQGAAALLLLLVLLVGPLGAWLAARARALRDAAVALAAGTIFYLFRDQLLVLGDSPNLVRDPVGAVMQGGYYTFLEELVGMWLPVRIARQLYLAGTPPSLALLHAYQAVSIACGAVYTVALGYAARRVRYPLAFAPLFLANSAVLLFAGYVENYVTATLLLALGFLKATQALREGPVPVRTVVATNVLFTLALVCHGVSAWSVFALVWLALVAARGSLRRFVLLGLGNALLAAALVGVIYAVFSLWLTPGVGWVHVGPRAFLGWRDMLEHRPWSDHALVLLRVATPALAVLAVCTLVFPRAVLELARRVDIVFTLLYLLGFLIHQLVWRSTLGTERDWDLFGFTWLPLGWLGYRALEATEPRPATTAAVLVLAAVAGFGWVLAFARPGL
jgi:hypothetical protein